MLWLLIFAVVSVSYSSQHIVTTPDLCGQQESCATCLQTKNCGWRYQINKCTALSYTQEPDQSWITQKCPEVLWVEPNQVLLTTTAKLSIFTSDLPPSDEQLICVFTAGSVTMTTNATNQRYPPPYNRILCDSPVDFPPLPAFQDDIVTKVSVRTPAGFDLVSTYYTYFNCSRYNSCTECVSSPFPCYWNIGDNNCTHENQDGFLVTGLGGYGPYHRFGPQNCQRITTHNGPNEILIPGNTNKRIRVSVESMLGPLLFESNFRCHFASDGHVYHVKGHLVGYAVECEPFDFKFRSNSVDATSEISISVTWKENEFIDNPENVHIVMYQCGLMAENKEMCLALPKKFKCGWCDFGLVSSCIVEEQCVCTTPIWTAGAEANTTSGHPLDLSEKHDAEVN